MGTGSEEGGRAHDRCKMRWLPSFPFPSVLRDSSHLAHRPARAAISIVEGKPRRPPSLHVRTAETTSSQAAALEYVQRQKSAVAARAAARHDMAASHGVRPDTACASLSFSRGHTLIPGRLLVPGANRRLSGCD